MPTTTLGENIKAARKNKKLTQRQLADLIGAKHNSVSNWETGINKPDPDMLGLICGVLEVSPNELLGSVDSLPHFAAMQPVTIRRVPILGGAACGTPVYQPGDGTEYATIAGDEACDFALIADGDSMIGDRIYDGDVVFFVSCSDVDDGQIAAVAVDDAVSIKHIKRLRLPDGTVFMTQLLSSNPKYDSIDIGGPDETRIVRIIGKAVAFKAPLNK